MLYSNNSWLSGFADGEGSFGFNVQRKNNHEGCYPVFSLALRDDDSDILISLQREFGGNLIPKKAVSKYGSKPQLHWKVGGKKALPGLLSYFYKFPLQTKKKRDFDIWAPAVEVYVLGRSTDPILFEARRSLQEIRIYNS